MKFYVKNVVAIALCFGLVAVCRAQNAPGTQSPDQATPSDQTPPPAARPRSLFLPSQVRCRNSRRPSSMPDCLAK
jgi:hypothetical protein